MPLKYFPTDALTLHATCDNWMRIFFDGSLAFEDERYGIYAEPWAWMITTEIEIPPGTKTIGISCLNGGFVKGIIASTSDGKVTDKTWQCTSDQSENWLDSSSEAQFVEPIIYATNDGSSRIWGIRFYICYISL